MTISRKNNEKFWASSQYKNLIKAIEEKNCSAFIMHLDSIETLYFESENNKSIIQLFRESSIDINKKIMTEMSFGKYEFTPLQLSYVLKSFNDFSPCINEIKIILALGANVNQFIDNKGNTELHFYMKRPNINFMVVREFYKAKGNFFIKNHEGKTPLDLVVNQEYVDFLNHLIAYTEIEKKRIVLRMLRKGGKIAENNNFFFSVHLEHRLLEREAKEPEANPPDNEKIEKWIDQHKDEEDKLIARSVIKKIQYIPHSKFLEGLKKSVNKFNEYILSFPKKNRNYVILIDYREDKSSWWVTKLAEKYLHVPPVNIIDTKELLTFKPDKNINHLVFFDDASYTGNLLLDLFSIIRDKILPVNNKNLIYLNFHLVCPFMSVVATKRIKSLDFVTIHSAEKLHSFSIEGKKFSLFNCKAETAAYFDHKIPEDISTIKCLSSGALINGEEGIRFTKNIIPPYKNKPIN